MQLKNMLSVLFILSVIGVSCQEVEGADVEVEISQIESDKGQMLVALYNAEDQWLKKPFKGTSTKIEDGSSKVVFKNIPMGTYAVSCFHDEDNDGKLDTFLGIPTEDTGASNNAPSKMGPPKWEDAKFEIKNKSIKQNIKL